MAVIELDNARKIKNEKLITQTVVDFLGLTAPSEQLINDVDIGLFVSSSCRTDLKLDDVTKEEILAHHLIKKLNEKNEEIGQTLTIRSITLNADKKEYWVLSIDKSPHA